MNNLKLAKSMLSNFRFHAEFFTEEDGSVTSSLEEIDIIVNGADKEQAKTELAKDLLEYAQMYHDEFDLFFNSKNRKEHLPYVLNVLMQSDIQSIVNLIDE
jgi:antitoxin YefM